MRRTLLLVLMVMVLALQFGEVADGLQIGFPKPGCYPCPRAE